MIQLLDNAGLASDFDAFNLTIRNCREVDGADNVLHADDIRLLDGRPILPASVLNDSVAPNAGIQQIKLDLSDLIPTSWLGTRSDQAGQGDLVQPLSEKDVADGYAGLDNNGQLPSASVAATTTGTLKIFSIILPPELVMGPDRAENGNNTLVGDWYSPEGGTWLGNVSGASGKPRFTKLPLYDSLIPSFAASKITSGVFPVERLPVAVGVGSSHATGLAPTTGPDGDPNDYLARDMTYKTMVKSVDYQPSVPSPAITIISLAGSKALMRFTCPLDNVSLFYRISDMATFSPAPDVVQVDRGTKVSAYAAKIGYNNSPIVSYTVPMN